MAGWRWVKPGGCGPYCMAKGKEHKKYEFGGKASVAMCKQSGVIVAAVAHEKNLYDGDTLPEVLGQAEVIMERRPEKAIVDRYTAPS
jgi:transposase, IS5 family